MKTRTGDILIWRSTHWYDLLSESTILLKGYHSGLILKGERFSSLSTCGPSPTHTYVTFFVDKVFPLEEVVGHIWYKPNGTSLDLIKRIGGRRVSSKEAYDVFQDYLNLKKRPNSHIVFYACAAYLKVGQILPETGHEKKNFRLCSGFIAYMLKRFGFLDKRAIVNNLLPVDFWNCRFYQTQKYKRVNIFDKGTAELAWFLMLPLFRHEVIKKRPVRSKKVEKIMGHWNYPKSDIH